MVTFCSCLLKCVVVGSNPEASTYPRLPFPRFHPKGQMSHWKRERETRIPFPCEVVSLSLSLSSGKGDTQTASPISSWLLLCYHPGMDGKIQGILHCEGRNIENIQYRGQQKNEKKPRKIIRAERTYNILRTVDC